MKIFKFVILVFCAFSLISCDPEHCYDYLISNISQNNIELVIYGEEIINKTIEKDLQLT